MDNHIAHRERELSIFIHIPKTSGTNFSFHVLDTVFGSGHIWMNQSWHINNFPEISQRLRENQAPLICIRNHHAPYALMHNHFPDAKFLVMFRDPIERFASQYYHYLRRYHTGPEEAKFVRDNQIKLSELTQYPQNNNLQSHAISHAPLDNFFFIGLTEQYERSIKLFLKLYNSEHLFSGIMNQVNENKLNKNSSKTDQSKYILSDQTRNLIAENNVQDLLLYEQVVEEFERRCQLYSI